MSTRERRQMERPRQRTIVEPTTAGGPTARARELEERDPQAAMRDQVLAGRDWRRFWWSFGLVLVAIAVVWAWWAWA
jgi:hypothetical protein